MRLELNAPGSANRPALHQKTEEESKMRIKPTPTQKELQDTFDYKDGNLYWKVKRVGVKRGTVAGCFNPSDGYWQINLMYSLYRAHRLIWVWHHGEIPVGAQIDHIDGNRVNNDLSNLRLALNGHSDNMQNTARQSNNTTGFTGVTLRKTTGKYQAKIRVNNKHIHLGYYETALEAADVYKDARNKLFSFQPNQRVR